MNNGVALSTPTQILLATDLTARCDRPLERARQLAREWQAELVLLTVREAPETPGEVIRWLDADSATAAADQAAQREVTQEFAGSGLAVSLRIAEGEVASAILDAAAGLPGSIVIAGTAYNQTLGGLILGSTVERLARGLSQPLLVVRQRARHPYRSILVATDFSAASRMALETAVQLFPDRPILVCHAREAGLDGLAVDPPANESRAREACARFVDSCKLPADVRRNLYIVMTDGAPGTALPRSVHEHGIELAVLGLHTQPGLMRVLLGSKGEQLLRNLECDTLLVRTGGRDDAS